MCCEKKNQADEKGQMLNSEKKRAEEYLTRLKYLQADFENLKKRCERDVEEAKKYSTERLIVQLLDVVDELELALKTARSAESVQSLIDGVQMTLKKLTKILQQEGAFPIECKEGNLFDPEKHYAVAATQQDNIEVCTLTEEVRKGYIMKNKVIRPSIVKVAIKSSKSKEDNKNE
ncbi:nucleotide exchange factor GrpE [Candidatus Woesearchaeota archaeon]|nr:nucleotide exchange factor GrpE [Candidatus Woesearchaeota archaeon]